MSGTGDDRVPDLLEHAARLADVGEPAEGARLALQAAALLPAGDPDKHSAHASAAALLTAAALNRSAADAWAAAAEAACDDDSRARDLSAEGDTARLAGLWWRAVEAYSRALALVAAHAPDSIDTAIVAHSLAVAFTYTGRFDSAETLYHRALAIAEARRDRQLVAAVCHDLGGLAHARGDHAAGVAWARRSVAEREALDDPIGLAVDRGALGALLLGAGDLEEAGRLLHAARETLAAHLGDRHQDVAVVDDNLAVLALAEGDLSAAERRARSALAVKEDNLGADHPELAVTLTTLGSIRRERGDRRESARLHRRALAVLRPAVELHHPLLRTIQENLAAATAATSDHSANQGGTT